MFAISSINEFVAPVLDMLDSWGLLRRSSLSGDLVTKILAIDLKSASSCIFLQEEEACTYLLLAEDSPFPSEFNFLFLG